MTKFQKIQICSSVVPGLSTFFVATVTCAELKRKHSRFINYIYLGVNLAISCLVLILLNGFIMTGQHPILNIIASGVLLFLTNYLCVQLQQKCAKEQAEGNPKSNNVKYVLACIGACAVGIAVTLILVFLIVFLLAPEPMEDLNGADTSLAVFTKEEVLTGIGNKWNALFVSEGLYGEHTNVAERWISEAYDYDKCSFKCKTINGVKTMQITNIESDSLTLSIESVLESGNMEIYVIVDGILYEKVPVGQAYSSTIEGIAGKDVEVRFAAESAKLSIQVIRYYEGQPQPDYSKNHALD